MALETIMSPPNNVSSYQQPSNESSSAASPSVHARYEKPEIAKYGSSRVRVRNTTKTSISPMPHVTLTGQPPQVLQPLLLSEHGQRSAEALEKRKNKNNYKNCRHSLFATPFRRHRSHIVEHQQKNDEGAKGQQQVGTPRSAVPPSPTTPRSNRQGTIMETPTTVTCLQQQLPTPTENNKQQQIQQQPQQPQQQHERITEKEPEPTSNEIESLETCSSVSLDIVDQDFPWSECIGYATSSNPTASVFFIQIPPSLTTVTDDMSSADSDSDSDTDSSSDSDSVYSFGDDDDESDEDVDQSKNQCISQVLVVKSSHTIVQELFGLFLAEWFHIRTPQVALIEKFPHARFTLDETEQNGVSRDKDTLSIEQRVGYHWKQLIHSLKRMAQQDENYGLEIKVDKDLGSSMFLLLMEFMSSAQSLDELDSGGAVAVDDQTMEEDDDGDVNDTSTGRDDSEKPTVLLCDSVPFCTLLLRGLGRLVIVDILLNNWDRIPAIWDNYGNAGNVLIGVEQFDDDGGDTEREDGESSVKVVVYGIDQALSCIVEESDQQLYLDKVQQFVRDYSAIKGAAQGEQGEPCGEAFVSKIDSSVYLQSILDFVKNPFRSMADVKGVERRLAISDHEAKVAIWKGMRDSVRRTRKLSLRQLRKLKRRVNRMKTGRSNETANEYWNRAMDSLLDINFVHRIAQQFQQKPMNQ